MRPVKGVISRLTVTGTVGNLLFRWGRPFRRIGKNRGQALWICWKISGLSVAEKSLWH